MTNVFTNKVRIGENKLGVHNRRYRIIKARSMAKVLDQVNRLTRWGWALDTVGGVTPRVTLVKTEIITDDGEQSEIVFPQRYDAEKKEMVSIYHKYVTKWAFTHDKMVRIMNSMLARGYDTSFNMTTTFGYRTVFVKTFIKDVSESKA